MGSKEIYNKGLTNVSACDGRHSLITSKLSEYFSEHALYKYRTFVELKHLIKMAENPVFGLKRLGENERDELLNIFNNFSEQDSRAIAEYDHFGRNGIGPLEHDVKSVELFLREKMQGTKFDYLLPMIHFGFTSEDVNNVAYNCMIRDGVEKVWLPQLIDVCYKLKDLAVQYRETPLLSRTHGQPASPTTFGKEMAVYLKRFTNQIVDLKSFKLSAKMNGAVGNYNAQIAGYPNLDWLIYSEEFIQSFGFEFEVLTNQRGPKDKVVKLFQNVIRTNSVLKDLDLDLWLYVTQDLVLQKKVESHVGSSTMPHKINPWLIECSEGNTEISNALFEVFSRELEVSRLQRDLSDHDLERNYGLAFGYSLVALDYSSQFLDRIIVNEPFMLKELKKNYQVLSEAYQTILRTKGRTDAYSLFKDAFRDNSKFDQEKVNSTIDSLDIDEETKLRMKNLKVEDYIGLAPKLVDIAVENFNKVIERK